MKGNVGKIGGAGKIVTKAEKDAAKAKAKMQSSSKVSHINTRKKS